MAYFKRDVNKNVNNRGNVNKNVNKWHISREMLTKMLTNVGKTR